MVDVLEAQQKASAFCDGKAVGHERGEGMAQVEISGGAGGEARSDHDEG